MANYLLLGTAGESWRLPARTDANDLRNWLAEAAQAGELVNLSVEMNNDPRQGLTITVNPSALGWWAVFEKPDPDSRIIA